MMGVESLSEHPERDFGSGIGSFRADGKSSLSKKSDQCIHNIIARLMSRSKSEQMKFHQLFAPGTDLDNVSFDRTKRFRIENSLRQDTCLSF